MSDEVVKLVKEGNIGVVAMEEREFKNTFSERFVKGLIASFDEIDRSPDIKVVLLHGYDNYFCCGGTKEELIKMVNGEVRFADLNFYDLPLRCRVPVISAMQGHALGGGLVLGCYADIIVLGEECIYGANFMKYGFTPGMGATFIIPEKFGSVLGTEMLFRAENYFGRDLKERGAPVKIVKKQNVIGTAMKIARELEDKPLLALKTLKEHLSRKMRSQLPDVIAEELRMHDLTFSQTEVLSRIETLFGGVSRMPKNGSN